jgi:N6-adenosine-specific RNA methylase IME4
MPSAAFSRNHGGSNALRMDVLFQLLTIWKTVLAILPTKIERLRLWGHDIKRAQIYAKRAADGTAAKLGERKVRYWMNSSYSCHSLPTSGTISAL